MAVLTSASFYHIFTVPSWSCPSASHSKRTSSPLFHTRHGSRAVDPKCLKSSASFIANPCDLTAPRGCLSFTHVFLWLSFISVLSRAYLRLSKGSPPPAPCFHNRSQCQLQAWRFLSNLICQPVHHCSEQEGAESRSLVQPYLWGPLTSTAHLTTLSQPSSLNMHISASHQLQPFSHLEALDHSEPLSAPPWKYTVLFTFFSKRIVSSAALLSPLVKFLLCSHWIDVMWGN